MTTEELDLQIENLVKEKRKIENKVRIEKFYENLGVEIEKAKEGYKAKNRDIEFIYKSLTAKESLKSFFTLKKSTLDFSSLRLLQGSLYREFRELEIEDEDLPVVEYEKYAILTPYNNFFGVEYVKEGADFKVDLSTILPDGRRTKVKITTAIEKVETFLSTKEEEKRQRREIKIVEKRLIEEYQAKYPEATIVSREEWISRPTISYRADIIHITFPNKNWVKVRYYLNGTTNVFSKYREEPSKVDELLDVYSKLK